MSRRGLLARVRPAGRTIRATLSPGTAGHGAAATMTVDLTNGDGYTDIQTAIDAAEDGDSVLVKPGEYVITRPITFRWKIIEVIAENGLEATTIRMSSEPTDPDRASVVIFEDGETAATERDQQSIAGAQWYVGQVGKPVPVTPLDADDCNIELRSKPRAPD